MKNKMYEIKTNLLIISRIACTLFGCGIKSLVLSTSQACICIITSCALNFALFTFTILCKEVTFANTFTSWTDYSPYWASLTICFFSTIAS